MGSGILRVWVGPVYAAHGALYLRILVIANMIRLSATPYSVLLMGTAQQKLAIGSPVFEGLTNLVVSLIGGYWFGAIGVAVGTLIGAIVGVLRSLRAQPPADQRNPDFYSRVSARRLDGAGSLRCTFAGMCRVAGRCRQIVGVGDGSAICLSVDRLAGLEMRRAGERARMVEVAHAAERPLIMPEQRIGVVTVTYNSGRVIDEFLQCLLAQTYRRFVLYVIAMLPATILWRK